MKKMTIEERKTRVMTRVDVIKRAMNALARDCSDPELFVDDPKGDIKDLVHHELSHIVGMGQAVAHLSVANACKGPQQPMTLAALLGVEPQEEKKEEEEKKGVN